MQPFLGRMIYKAKFMPNLSAEKQTIANRLVQRSCLEFLSGVSIEFRYAGCVDESA